MDCIIAIDCNGACSAFPRMDAQMCFPKMYATVVKVVYELPVAAAVGQLGPKHRVPLPQLMRLISSACLQ